jgi:hypothetical protein
MTLKLGRTLSALPDKKTVQPWYELEAQFVALAYEAPSVTPVTGALVRTI